MESISNYLENGTAFLFIVGVLVVFSVVSLLLFVLKIYQIIQQNKKPDESKAVVVEEEDVGVVINGSSIKYKGKKLKYFILKDNSYESEKLPVGTKVKVLKKTSDEAYVKPV